MTERDRTLLTGLSAFPLTPLLEGRVDERAVSNLVGRLAMQGVDSITVLGSTGSYAYLTREERARVIDLGVKFSRDTPLFAGIGGLRTQHVLEYAEDAQRAGVEAVMLAPVSYQRLTPDDVLRLYTDVDRELSVPLIVYDNPGTSGFEFTDELLGALGELPSVASVKIPPLPDAPEEAAARVAELRSVLPERVTIGISGDAHAAAGLRAGCDAWYSAVGGTLPEHALAIWQLAKAGRHDDGAAFSQRLQPIWDLFERHGSLRVISAIAEYLGLAAPESLPLPILGLDEAARADVARIVEVLVLPA